MKNRIPSEIKSQIVVHITKGVILCNGGVLSKKYMHKGN